MPKSKFVQPMIHKDRRVLQVYGAGFDLAENLKLLEEYASQLRRQGPKNKALVLLDFANADYSVQAAMAWKKKLAFFAEHVGKSAAFGAGPMARTAINGFIRAGELLGYPLGPDRARIFDSRDEALDWLTEN